LKLIAEIFLDPGVTVIVVAHTPEHSNEIRTVHNNLFLEFL